MAVWGRAIAVVAVLGALAACEYAEEGEPLPSAVASPSTIPSMQTEPSRQAELPPVQTTPDPTWLARMEQNVRKADALLGPAPEALVLGFVGPLSGGGGRHDGAIEGTSGALPAGDYVFKVVCVGDTSVDFRRNRNDGTSEKVKVPCGKTREIRRTLPDGQVTLELAGQGTTAAGGIQVFKAPTP